MVSWVASFPCLPLVLPLPHARFRVYLVLLHVGVDVVEGVENGLADFVVRQAAPVKPIRRKPLNAKAGKPCRIPRREPSLRHRHGFLPVIPHSLNPDTTAHISLDAVNAGS